MFCLCIFSSIFRLMVRCKAFGAYVGDLGPLFGTYFGDLGRSWAALWAYVGGVGLLLGAYGGGLGPLLGPMLAVLGRSWGLCGRSGAEKCQEHSYLENMFISRAGARSAAWGSVLSRS